MDRYNWAEIQEDKLNDSLSRRMIHTAALTIAKLRLAKGAIVPLHHHVNEQVTTVETGSLRFEVGGESFVVKAGESVAIPPDLPHLVEAMEDSTATDVFTPRREDWISGADHYLRK